MTWKHEGLNDAFGDAEERIRQAADRADIPLDPEYRELLDEAFSPICEQIVDNPKDSVRADVQRLRRRDDWPWYVAYTEFEGWLMIYQVIEDTTAIRKIGQMSDPEILALLFDNGDGFTAMP